MNEECGFCKQYWAAISRTEDELYRMKKHPKIYKDAIPQLEKELQQKYAIVRKCRERNHPETMY